MTVESASYISQLDATLPAAGDQKSEGDDHFRLIKSVLKTQFPNLGTAAAVTPTAAEVNLLVNAGTTGASGLRVATQAPLTNSTLAASTAYTDAAVTATAFSTALPSQTGNSGKLTTTDGTTASWTAIKTVNGNSLLGSGDIATPDTIGFRNRIINGDFKIDQRNAGAAQTITAGAALAYTVDRWYAYCTGANVTGQQVAGSSQTQKRYQFTGAASVTAIGFGTRLEAQNTYDLNSQTVTIAADLANSLLTTVTWTLYRATTSDDTFGTLASPTITQIATGTFTVNSTVTRYNAQASVPAAATTGLQLVLSVGAQTSGTWTIGDVQLELGSTATAFEQRPYPVELAMCQRYYYRIPGSSQQAFGTSANVSTTLTDVVTTFQPKMRAAPTALQQSGTAGDYGVVYGSTFGACSAVPTFSSATTETARTRFTMSSGLTAGYASIPYAVNANGYLAWSAEL